jgi:hypothetical protein
MQSGSILKSRKGQIVLIGIVAILGVTLGGAALGLSDEQKSEAINALEWLIGLLIGGHTLTDIAHGVAISRERTAIEQESSKTERERIRNEANNTTTEIEVSDGEL